LWAACFVFDGGAVVNCYGWTYLVGGVFRWSVHCLVAFVVAVVVTERRGIANAGVLSWHLWGFVPGVQGWDNRRQVGVSI